MNIHCCSNQLGNTGVSPCDKPFGSPFKKVLVPVFANDGTKNKISAASTITDAAILALLNHADKSKRWYPLPEIHNPESERAEPVTEEDTLGNVQIVRDAARSISVQFWETTTAYLKELKKFEHIKVGIYEIDNEGKVMGVASGTDLYPIPIQGLYFNYMFNTGEALAKIMMTYQYKMNVKDSDLAYIGSSTFETDMTTIEGLLNAFSSLSEITVTSTLLSIKIWTNGANIGKKIGVCGLLVSNFSLANVTESETVTLGTLTEVSDGHYEISITGNAPSAGDDLTLTITRNGYDFTQINDLEIEAVS
jgi:hypothetical protein